MITGILSRSIGLVADSLDMLADSFVYGLSLMAVGSSRLKKKRVAQCRRLLSGYSLAIIGFGEIIRRFLECSSTFLTSRTMIIVSVLALIANAIVLRAITAVKRQRRSSYESQHDLHL
jgi:Co/Zn/Cd efflux system component